MKSLNALLLVVALQTASAPLKFEVASIKTIQMPGQLSPGSGCHGIDTQNAAATLPLGRCVLYQIKLAQLILRAFPPAEPLLPSTSSTVPDDYMGRLRVLPANQWVIGTPGWADEDIFAIDAKAEDPSHTTQNQLHEMLGNLVKERFKLTFHMVPKEVEGYLLVPAKGGMKLKEPSGPTNAAINASKRAAGITPFPIAQGTLASFAFTLNNRLRIPVMLSPETNIPGNWDFTPLDGLDLGTPGSPNLSGDNGSIFTALQERIGLKLEPHKIPVQIFVIDHVEKPTN